MPPRLQDASVLGGVLSNYRACVTILTGVVAVKIALLFALCLTSILVMDEFVQLGFAKYLGNGFFDTIWPVKAVGYAVFYKIAHAIGWDAVSTLLAGRVITALLGCAIVGMIFACARLLYNGLIYSLLVLVTLLSFSNFIERIFRTRAEPLAVFFAVASLLVLLRGEASRKSIFLAGMLTGLAFVTTQKSIYFNIALGAALVIDAAMMREFRLVFVRGFVLLAGWFVIVVLYCVAFGGLSPLPVAHNLFFGPTDLVSEVPKVYTGMDRFLLDTLLKNVLLYAICAAGMGLALARIFSLDSTTRIALVFSVVITGFVYTHNQPWPYVFVMALPFIALWAPKLLQTLSANPRYTNIVCIILAVALGSSFLRNGLYLTQYTNGDQLKVTRMAETVTGQDARYFDGVGMLPNRSEPSPLWLDKPLIERSLDQGVKSELFEIFTKSPPNTVIWSYRLDQVETVIQDQLDASYVKVAPNIRLSGRRLENGASSMFTVPLPGKYALYSDDGQPLAGPVLIEGKPATLPIALSTGPVTIEFGGRAGTALFLPQGRYQNILDANAPDYAFF